MNTNLLHPDTTTRPEVFALTDGWRMRPQRQDRSAALTHWNAAFISLPAAPCVCVCVCAKAAQLPYKDVYITENSGLLVFLQYCEIS